MYKILLIPGDGIGLEVIPAAERLLQATGLALELSYADAGWETFQKTGNSVPEGTLERVKAADATLAGAFTSPSGSQKVPGFKGAIRHLRRTLDLFANLRPAKSRPIPGSLQNVDMLMVRENTQGLYVEQERRYGDVAIADAVITKGASERVARVALSEARRRRGELAVVHKANVLPLTTGLFLESAIGVSKDFPDVRVYDLIVDAAAMKLVRDPQSFDVLVTTNLFGDILSDLMAGLVGGLGLAPSANLGEHHAIFEPVHGSAPDIAGRGVANPAATFLTAAMMLNHLGEEEVARKIDQAVDQVLMEGPRTGDLGGKATTREFADAVIEALNHL
ncbi:MAG: Homoisocitrate dehydrogenase [uncultured Truepera sp.]|uniref:Isocitrate/homoisocitrate dehydrogenase n=1 Tax=uncultured Truepera sp. TaxID=543023 RepID=A0A6J4UZQ9_9DEIN|nr:MAG: Homoisocitrate dehydrogenase [uncultured Truepera sp.]